MTTPWGYIPKASIEYLFVADEDGVTLDEVVLRHRDRPLDQVRLSTTEWRAFVTTVQENKVEDLLQSAEIAPRATILVDIDGTVALRLERSPYDETRTHEDRPNSPVIAAVQAMYASGHLVVFCSGRTEACREATEAWLKEHVTVPYEALYMRPARDTRRDAAIKQEIFEREIRGRYNVVAVFDDRQQVVDMWRSLGLTVFQVADGDF